MTRAIRSFPLALTLALVAPPAAAQATGTTTTVKPAGQPPFYRGKPVEPLGTAHLPVGVRLPDGVPESWVPTAALDELARRMSARLDDLGATRVMDPFPSERGVVAPWVYLGCALDTAGECENDPRENVLATTSGTRAWRARAGEAMERIAVERVLVVDLTLAPHWIHQKNFKGSKEARLGTDRSQRLPWLTSLDAPVWVLELTGAIVDREGQVVRSGGEGIFALRTPFSASALGAEQLMREADVAFVMDELRPEDDPSGPLVWESALSVLVTQLVGEPPR